MLLSGSLDVEKSILITEHPLIGKNDRCSRRFLDNQRPWYPLI
jgi:hypothetical protein